MRKIDFVGGARRFARIEETIWARRRIENRALSSINPFFNLLGVGDDPSECNCLGLPQWITVIIDNKAQGNCAAPAFRRLLKSQFGWTTGHRIS